MMYKVVNNLVHIPLANTVQLSYSRTRANHPLRNSNGYKHFLFPRVIPLWNSLPSDAVCAESVMSFHAKLMR